MDLCIVDDSVELHVLNVLSVSSEEHMHE